MDPEIALEAEEQSTKPCDAWPDIRQRAESPIDFDHLARYTLGERDLEREILNLFSDHLPITMSKLKAAASAKDWRVAAHSLKGSARAVGAWRLAEHAALAEKIDFPDDQTAVDDAVRNLEAAAGEARTFVCKLTDA
ncbi:MAG: Hpt domain-containing protein [Hyphomicrobiaceae bacterium]